MNTRIKQLSKTFLSDVFLEEKALEIIRWFKTEFTESLNCAATYAHLDDMVPYLLYFGETNLVKQIIMQSKVFSFQGLIYYGDRIVSYQNDEFLGGMVAYYELTKDDDVYGLIKQTARGIEQLLFLDGFMATAYDILKGKKTTITSPRTAAVLEVIIKYGEIFPSLKKQALETIDNWISTKFFKKFGLFPTKYYIGNRFLNFLCMNPCMPRIKSTSRLYKFNYSEYYKFGYRGIKKHIVDIIHSIPNSQMAFFAKGNSNFAYALIAAYQATGNTAYKDALIKIAKSLESIIGENNYITRPILLGRHIDRGTNNYDISLDQNEAVIDLLCDIYFLVDRDESYLRLAERMAEYWIGLRWGNGLVPNLPESDFDHIDNQTDFSVALYRLYDLTGKQRYRKIGREIFDAILKYHYSKKGYVLSVNKEGQICNRHVMIRHNALFLKCFALYGTDNPEIYKNNNLHDLMKDR